MDKVDDTVKEHIKDIQDKIASVALALPVKKQLEKVWKAVGKLTLSTFLS